MNDGPSSGQTVIRERIFLALCFVLLTIGVLWIGHKVDSNDRVIVHMIEDTNLRLASIEQRSGSIGGKDTELALQQPTAPIATVQVAARPVLPAKADETQRALDLAKQAKEKGQSDLAKIYYLSAVNHSPDDPRVLALYADAVFASGKMSSDELSRLRSVVQVTMYQLAPDYLPQALAILQKISALEAAQPTPSGNTGNVEDLGSQYKEVTAESLDSIQSDLVRLQKRIDNLTEIATAISDRSPATVNPSPEQVAVELNRTEQTLAVAKTANNFDQCIVNLGYAIDRDKDAIRAMSIVQAAEAALVPIWNFDLQNIPEALRTKIGAYPGKLSAGVDQIARIKSEPYLEKIKDQCRKAKAVVIGSTPPYLGIKGAIEKANEAYEECFATAQQAYLEIASKESRKEADSYLADIRSLIAASKKKQFDRYQKWVVDQITYAFYEDKSEWWTRKDDVMRRFSDYKIINIDQSSLAPETSRVFNDVVGKFLASLKSDQVVSIEHDMSEVPKMKPENL